MLDIRTSAVQQRLVTPKRRRSLGALLRLPFPITTRTPTYQAIADANGPACKQLPVVSSVPLDIIREIVDLLSPADILSFSLTSSSVRDFLLPALYDVVTLKSSRACRVTLEMLVCRPELCQYIRKIAVRPNYYLAWPTPDDALNEEWVAWMIEKLAPHLGVLDTFDWDGLEMPVDSLWLTLRSQCPNLRNVSSNVGSTPINPCSELFNFSDLKSFSFIVRYGLDGSALFPTSENLPPRCWQMLTTRCPELEELAICSFSPSTRNLDFLPATAAHWPRLNSLTLGSFGYRSDFSLGAGADPAFFAFLDAHRSLTYVRLQWNFARWMSPAEIPLELSPAALPKLESFVGVHQQLVRLPHPERIESVDLTCEPLHATRAGAVCPVLKLMTALSSLDIWVHVVPSEDEAAGVLGSPSSSCGFLREVIDACPKLTELHFMCTTPFSGKPLKELLDLLPLLPCLRRFSLTKGHRYGEGTMLSLAVRILQAHPVLRQVNIRWARERSPNHLKQEGTYDVVRTTSASTSNSARKRLLSKARGKGKAHFGASAWVGGKRRRKGKMDGRDVYKEGTQAEEQQLVLAVYERGIPLVGRPFTKKYTHIVGKRWSAKAR